jgi:hypothetical protein
VKRYFLCLRTSPGIIGAALAFAVASAGCATAASPSDNGGDGGTPGTGNNNSGNMLGSASNSSLSMQSGQLGVGDGGLTTNTNPDAGHQKRCDDAGHCSCINIASIGHEGVWGPCSTDTTTAFQTWLNTQSTAKVDTYDQTKPMLTSDFLAQYDVIVLQWMVANGMQGNDGAPWSFTTDEVNALSAWVNAGGGLVVLSGYQATDPTQIFDIQAPNQLLSFTDIQYNKVISLSTLPANNYCWGGSVPLGGPAADGGVTSVGTWDQNSPIGAHVTSVGAYDARTITSTTATVDCTDGTNNYAVHEQIGQGHVVAYVDEWITYSGEWNGMSQCIQSSYRTPGDPCYGKTPEVIFQVPKFWYNAIKYAASSVTCFDIQSPYIIR